MVNREAGSIVSTSRFSMPDRETQILAFLTGAGWGGAERRPLAADASFRRYHRLQMGDQRAVLMDAPPPMEDIRPFVTIARHLAELGYSAPRLLSEDPEAGLLLLEDLGDDTFTRLLAGGESETDLYELATDLLIDLHRRPADQAIPNAVPPYDDERLLDEATLLTDWYVPQMAGTPLAAATAQEYRDLWRLTLRKIRSVPETLVLRDYHVDNLMRIDGREGIAACGLLDFQDAVRGPVTYDLVSLIEDARRDIAPSIATSMRDRYLAAFPTLDREGFDRSMAILGAQRHAKVIGIFTRLCVRDGKSDYLRHIPRVWRLLESACLHPVLSPIRAWLDHHVPPTQRGIPPEVRS
jgi:aminoglycoside/choline kinase family phosphotransferase